MKGRGVQHEVRVENKGKAGSIILPQAPKTYQNIFFSESL